MKCSNKYHTLFYFQNLDNLTGPPRSFSSANILAISNSSSFLAPRISLGPSAENWDILHSSDVFDVDRTADYLRVSSGGRTSHSDSQRINTNSRLMLSGNITGGVCLPGPSARRLLHLQSHQHQSVTQLHPSNHLVRPHQPSAEVGTRNDKGSFGCERADSSQIYGDPMTCENGIHHDMSSLIPVSVAPDHQTGSSQGATNQVTSIARSFKGAFFL